MLPIIGILIILASIGYFLFFFNKPTQPALANISPVDSTDSPQSSPALAPTSSSTPLPSSASGNEKILDTKITNLEKTVNSLNLQVTSLNQKYSTLSGTGSTTITPTPTPIPNSAVYVTLGSNGQANDQSYTPIPGFAVTLNPADFPGYKSVTLEATMSRVQLGGTANLQLFNQTTGQAITASTVTTSSTTFQLVSSSPFQLASGSNTYVLTIQSSDNTNVQVNIARLKINF